MNRGGTSFARRPDVWDDWCLANAARNDEIIPELARRLSRFAASVIIDVGCASGYVAREVAKRVPTARRWFLIDAQPEMVAFAVSHMPAELTTVGLAASVHGQSQWYHGTASDLLLVYTLIETRLDNELAAVFTRMVRSNGRIHVVYPDTWEDVLQSTSIPEPDGPSVQFRKQGNCTLLRTDRVDGSEREFHCQRNELIISYMLGAGWALVLLTRHECDGRGHYVMTFARTW